MMKRRPPDDGPEELAASFTESLFAYSTPSNVPHGLYLDDVQLEISGFDADARLLEAHANRADRQAVFPMVKQGASLIPIALQQLTSPWPFLDPDSPTAQENVARVFSDVVPMELNEARSVFRSLVYSFLTVRIQSVLDYFNDRTNLGNQAAAPGGAFVTAMPTLLGGATSVVGFRVDVATRSANVRIHSSLKIRRNWSYFGYYIGPKPVVAGLTGGIYEFGVELTSGTVTPDSAQFDIPYKTLSPRLVI